MRVKPALITALAALAVVLVIQQTRTEGSMPRSVFQNSADISDFVPFPEDIARITTVWNAPVPSDLSLIGGVDEIGYARVWSEADDPKGHFHGSILNHEIRYQGLLRYEHPTGAPFPADTIDTYVMSHIQDDRLIIGQDSVVPRDWFWLVPVDPTDIERAAP